MQIMIYMANNYLHFTCENMRGRMSRMCEVIVELYHMYVHTYVYTVRTHYIFMYLCTIGLPPINNITVSGNMCFETSVNISWNPPSINNNGVSYQVMVLSTSSNVLFILNTIDTFYTFTNFSESTNYTVRIASVSMLGNGIYNIITFYVPGQDDFALGGKYLCICVYVCIYTYVRRYVHAYVCVYVCMYVI